MRNFLRSLFPFLLVDVLTAAIFPFLPFFTLLLAAAHSIHSKKIASGRRSGRAVSTGHFLYYCLLLLLLYVLTRVCFPFHLAILSCAVAAAAGASFLKKISPLAAAGAVLNFLAVLLMFMVVPPKITPRLVDRLMDEEFAKPVYLYMGSLDKYDRDILKTYNGVRSITSNRDETRIFFTAKGNGEKGEYSGLFSLDPRNPVDVKKWGEGRIFDAQLTRDGKYLLATDYNNGRLFMLDPVTLQPVRSAKTFPRPMFVIVDREFDRVFVLHEIGGLYIQFALPGLNEIKKTLTFSAPVALAVGWKSGEMYTANWLFPCLLSEIDIFRPDLMRVKFPFSFTGSGVSLDDSRRRVYVANAVSGRIFAVDRDSFKTVGKITNLPAVRPVLVDGKRRLIYAAGMLSPYVFIYDFSHREVGRVYIGEDCRVLYLTPATNRLLAGNMFGIVEIDVDGLLKDGDSKSTDRRRRGIPHPERR